MLKILVLAACMIAVAPKAQAADRAAPQPAPAQARGHVKVFDGRTEAAPSRADMMHRPPADRLAAPARPQMLPAVQKVRDVGR